MDELLSLKWKNHSSTFLQVLGLIRKDQTYSDVTLTCSGKFYSAHKMVLTACSDYFCEIFQHTDCKKPVIVLKGIGCKELEMLLDYMYIGEVNVKQSDITALIHAAECLQIKGLAEPDEPPKQSKYLSSKRSLLSQSPKIKRKSTDSQKCSEPKHFKADTTPPPSNTIKNYIPINKREVKGDDDYTPLIIKEEIVDTFTPNRAGIPPFVEPDISSDRISSQIYDQPQPSNLETTHSHIQEQQPDTSPVYQNREWTGEEAGIDYSPFAEYEDSSGPSQSDKEKCSTCLLCFKKLASQSLLKTHMRVHTGEKPYPCPYCEYKATQKGNLKTHIRTVHAGAIIRTN